MRYLVGSEPAHTQTTVAERAALARDAAGRKRLVEIGVYEGFTTAILARAMAPDAVLHAMGWVAELGSFRFFEENIRQDSRFEIVEQVDSLSILRRQASPGALP